MSTITAIFQPHADGSIHLPLPASLRNAAVKVTATLEPASGKSPAPKFGCLAGKIKMAPDFDEPVAEFQEYQE